MWIISWSVSTTATILVVLAPPLKRTLVVRIPADLAPRLGADALAVLLVAAGSGGGRLLEEEVEELVGDGEVGLLLELLQGCKTEEHFEEGERCSDVTEERVRDGRCEVLWPGCRRHGHLMMIPP